MASFLQVNKKFFNSKLKSLDILILSQIEEYNRTGQDCFISNKTLSEMFGESESSIKRSLDKLENLELIKRQTTFTKNNGQSSKKRLLYINEAGFNMNFSLNKLGSKSEEARFKNDVSKVHIDPIKEKIKYKIKEDNIASQCFTFTPQKSDYDFLETFKQMLDDGLCFEKCISIIKNPDNGYTNESIVFYINELKKYNLKNDK